jgi:hypothetical protein
LHSSYPELEHFVKNIKPKKLYSVSRHDNVALENEFGKFLSKEELKNFEIPISVKLTMESKQEKIVITKKTQTPKKVLAKKKFVKGVKIQESPSESESIDLTLGDTIDFLDKEESTLHELINNFTPTQELGQEDEELLSIFNNFQSEKEAQDIPQPQETKICQEALEINTQETQISQDELEIEKHSTDPVITETQKEIKEEVEKNPKKRPSPDKSSNKNKKQKFDLFSMKKEIENNEVIEID